MNTFLLVLIAAGFLYLVFFHKPINITDKELTSWFSLKLSDITSTLDQDIEQDKKGLYPHQGQQSLKKQGAIVYILPDKKGNRFDVSDRNNISAKNILDTDGYKKLKQKAKSLNLSIALEENEVNTDDDDTDSPYQEDDEHIIDHYRYFTVTISGW